LERRPSTRWCAAASVRADAARGANRRALAAIGRIDAGVDTGIAAAFRAGTAGARASRADFVVRAGDATHSAIHRVTGGVGACSLAICRRCIALAGTRGARPPGRARRVTLTTILRITGCIDTGGSARSLSNQVAVQATCTVYTSLARGALRAASATIGRICESVDAFVPAQHGIDAKRSGRRTGPTGCRQAARGRQHARGTARLERRGSTGHNATARSGNRTISTRGSTANGYFAP